MLSKLSPTRRGATTFLLTALLAACGGGGGGDDGPPAGVTADLSAGSYEAASTTAAGTTLGSLDAVALFAGDGAVAAASAGARPLAISRAAVQRLMPSRATIAATDRRVGTLAVTTSTEACPGGGSLTTAVDDADDSETLTANDTVRVTANNCVIEGETLTGSFQITVVRVVVSSSSEAATFTLAFNNFGSTLLRLNGSTSVDAAYTSTSEAVTLRYQGLTASFDGGSIEWRHTVAYSASSSQAPQVSFSGLIDVGNGFVALRQVSPFTLNASTGYPNAGILELTGANGGRVRLVAGSARFTFQFFAPGNAGATPDVSVPGRVYGS